MRKIKLIYVSNYCIMFAHSLVSSAFGTLHATVLILFSLFCRFVLIFKLGSVHSFHICIAIDCCY